MHVLIEKMLLIKFILVIIEKVLLDARGWRETNDQLYAAYYINIKIWYDW